MKKFVLAALLGVLACTQAQAGMIVSSFTVGNDGINGNVNVSSPYATLTLTDSASDGTLASNQVRFTLDLANGNDATFGSLGFNLNGVLAGDLSLASLSGTGGNTSAWSLSTGPVQMDGFGAYDMQVGADSNAQANRLTSLTFVVQDSAASLTVDNFLAPNSGTAGNPPGAFIYAAEYFPGAGGTGFIGVPVGPDTHSVTPIPGGIVLAGIGIGCCGGFSILRRKPQAA